MILLSCPGKGSGKQAAYGNFVIKVDFFGEPYTQKAALDRMWQCH